MGRVCVGRVCVAARVCGGVIMGRVCVAAWVRVFKSF